MSEVYGIANAFEQINMTLLYWDTQVNKELTINRSNKKDLLDAEIVGGGGTYLSCVADYIKRKNKPQPSISVHLTDGFIESSPTLVGSSHLFVLTKGGDSSRIKKYGKVATLD